MELDTKLTNEHSLSVEHLFQEDFFEDIPCAADEHDTDWEAHGGKTNWYMQMQCGNCGARNRVHPYCDRFRDWVHTKGHHIRCEACNKTTEGWDSVILCKRIGGNW